MDKKIGSFSRRDIIKGLTALVALFGLISIVGGYLQMDALRSASAGMAFLLLMADAFVAFVLLNEKKENKA